jgi:hypothetical protein
LLLRSLGPGVSPGIAGLCDLVEVEKWREISMRHKLVLWCLLLLAGFLFAFILQYSRLRRAQQELSESTKQLRSCQSSQQLAQLRDTTTMMVSML